MFVVRSLTVLFVAASLLLPAFAQNRKQAPARNRAGEQILGKLSRMTPAEREKALSRLPPARRAQLENRIRNFQNLPPAAQERRIGRLERLNSLPPQKRDQVRQSMRDLTQLPEARRKAINQELRRITALPPADRQSYMDTEDFRNRYSPSEQEMMSNLAELLPQEP